MLWALLHTQAMLFLQLPAVSRPQAVAQLQLQVPLLIGDDMPPTTGITVSPGNVTPAG